MHIPFENESLCLGYFEYLLYSLPMQDHKEIPQFIANLQEILSNQDTLFTDYKFSQISLVALKIAETNTDLHLQLKQKIQIRIHELSLITPENFDEISESYLIQQYESEKLAHELKECIKIAFPLQEITIEPQWFFERAEHFLIGNMRKGSPWVMDSVFAILPENYNLPDFKNILENHTSLYVGFQKSTGLLLNHLFQFSNKVRHMILENLKNLIYFANLSNCNFEDYFKIEELQLEHLINNLYMLKKINISFRFTLDKCLSWNPEKIKYIERNLIIFQSFINSKVSLEHLIELSQEELFRVKQNSYAVNLLSQNNLQLSTILACSNQQLASVYSNQRIYVRFFNKFGKTLPQDFIATENISLIPHYFCVGDILSLSFQQILELDERTLNLIHDNYPFFVNLKNETSIKVEDFLTWGNKTVYQIIESGKVFFQLLKISMSLEEIKNHIDDKLIILQKNNHFLEKWTKYNRKEVQRLLSMSGEDLETLFMQAVHVDELLRNQRLKLSQVITLHPTEREEIANLIPIYEYLLRAIPGKSLIDLLGLSHDVKKELIKYNYQYYKMLKAGFAIEQLCPLYRLFYQEMLDFCEKITQMHILMQMDRKRFEIVMSNSNAFKEYISLGHLTFQDILTIPHNILEELAKQFYLYQNLLKLSELSLFEFLKIDAEFRKKLALHAGNFPNVLRNLKTYIHLSSELQTEIFQHRHAYGKLLLLPEVRLEQLLQLPDSIRYQVLSHANLFASITPNLPLPLEHFVMFYEDNLIEFSKFLLENQEVLFNCMDFNYDDFLGLTLDECHDIILKADDLISIGNDFRCSIREFYFLDSTLQNRIVRVRHFLTELIQRNIFSFTDVLILDKRAGGEFFENISMVLSIIEEGQINKEDLLESDEIDLINMINSNATKKPRICGPSII